VPEFGAELKAVFVAPFASHRWASARGRSHWVDLEGWQDSIAGPVSAVAGSGGCAYVYEREDGYFAGVSDPAGLRSRLLDWHAALAAGVEKFAPECPAEASDLEFMRSLVSGARELIEQACAVERARWDAAKNAEQVAARDRGRHPGFARHQGLAGGPGT
jgi:hypothetical protein